MTEIVCETGPGYGGLYLGDLDAAEDVEQL